MNEKVVTLPLPWSLIFMGVLFFPVVIIGSGILIIIAMKTRGFLKIFAIVLQIYPVLVLLDILLLTYEGYSPSTLNAWWNGSGGWGLQEMIPTDADGKAVFIALLRDTSAITIITLLTWDRLPMWLRVASPLYYIIVGAPKDLGVALYNSTFSSDYPNKLIIPSILNTVCNTLIYIYCFGMIYRDTGLIDTTSDPKRVTRSRVDAFYFAMITFTTVGYGDIVPHSRKTRLLVCYEAVLGYLTMGAVVVELGVLLRAYLGTKQI